MAKLSTGIYIGKDYIDVVVLSGSLKKPILVEQVKEKIEIPSDEVYSSEERLNEKIIEAVKSAIGKLKTRSDKIFSALPETRIMLRHFTMPLLPKSEQAQAIKFEARKYIPFKLDNLFFDFKIINIDKEKKRMEVLFISAQKTDIELQLKLFKEIGLEINGIDIISFALLRVLNISYHFKKDETIALLQLSIDEDIAGISIVEANYPTISRDIPIVQHKEILTEKLISELRLSFDYYKRRGSRGKIKKLIIFGKDNLADLTKRLSEELDIEVEIAAIYKAINGIKPDSVGTTIAAGTAMNGLGRVVYGVDLLPEFAKPKKVMPEKWLILAIAILVLIILITLSYSTIVVSSANLRFRTVLNEAKTLPPVTQHMSVDELKKLRDKTLEIIPIFESLLTERIYLTNKLNRIIINLPEGTWITSLEVSNLIDSKIKMSLYGKVFLEDSSQQINTANKFLEALKQDEVFMNGFDYCEFGDITRDIVGDYELVSYSIQCGKRK